MILDFDLIIFRYFTIVFFNTFSKKTKIYNSEIKYRNLADNALIGIFRTTLDGEISYINKAISYEQKPSARILFSAGLIYYLSGNLDEGKIFFNRAIKLQPHLKERLLKMNIIF